jgi:hypothetical protein
LNERRENLTDKTTPEEKSLPKEESIKESQLETN